MAREFEAFSISKKTLRIPETCAERDPSPASCVSLYYFWHIDNDLPYAIFIVDSALNPNLLQERQGKRRVIIIEESRVAEKKRELGFFIPGT